MTLHFMGLSKDNYPPPPPEGGETGIPSSARRFLVDELADPRLKQPIKRRARVRLSPD